MTRLNSTEKVNKANTVAGCLNDTVWINRHQTAATKKRIYKSTIKQIMPDTVEASADSIRTRRLLETSGIRILRNITIKTLRDRM